METKKVRLSIDISTQANKLLKTCCIEKDLVPKNLIEKLVLNWIEDYQDDKNIHELKGINDRNQWFPFELLKRRMGWDAL